MGETDAKKMDRLKNLASGLSVVVVVEDRAALAWAVTELTPSPGGLGRMAAARRVAVAARKVRQAAGFTGGLPLVGFAGHPALWYALWDAVDALPADF